jgi:ABC-type polysaccharide/polyol phosphate export permease
VQIGSLGFVWGYLFKMPLSDYFPYLATSIVFWNFILSSITEGANIYINSISYLKELTIPKLSYINSLFIKNIIILLHNLVVLIPIFLYFGVKISFGGVCFSLLGFVVLCISLYLTIIPVALLSLRFRDFPNVVISLSQIIFYVTPIMWKLDSMPERLHQYIGFNPVAVFLSFCRDPLIGAVVPGTYYLVGVTYIFIVFAISILMFSKYRAKIVYWL